MPKRPRIAERKLSEEEELFAASIPDYARPRTRADCAYVPRPCPFVGCRYNLYLDETSSGKITMNYPNTPVLEMKQSCVLDLAEMGPLTLGEVSEALGLTPERIRQIEIDAMDRIRNIVNAIGASSPAAQKRELYEPRRQLTITQTLMHPTCRRMIVACIDGSRKIEPTHRAIMEILNAHVSLIKLRAYVKHQRYMARTKMFYKEQ